MYFLYKVKMNDGNSQGKRTKEQIIQAAIVAFSEKGAHGVTLQDVAERLRIKRLLICGFYIKIWSLYRIA